VGGVSDLITQKMLSKSY